MRDLLFLPHRIPYPPNKGDKIRAWHMLRYLAQRYRVHLGCFVDDPADWQYVSQLQALCASSRFIALRPLAARLGSLRGIASGEALSVAYYRHPRLQQWVDETLAQHRIDTALAFSGPMAQYLPARSTRGPLRRVLDLVDVDSEKWSAYAGNHAWPWSALYRREARQLLRFERAVACQFDALALVSGPEAELFRRRAPESRHKIGYFHNGVDATYFSRDPQRPSPFPSGQTALVFTGAMDYWPNIDAVSWFCAQALPQLRQRFPALRLYIVGARPTRTVLALSRQAAVAVTGTVADIRPYLQHAALVVAPLRIARGVQNKILEAMAMEQTVLATPQALEGIQVHRGSEVLCTGEASDFIREISYLLSSGSRPALGQAARQRILRDYCWDNNLARLQALLDPDAAVHVFGNDAMTAIHAMESPP